MSAKPSDWFYKRKPELFDLLIFFWFNHLYICNWLTIMASYILNLLVSFHLKIVSFYSDRLVPSGRFLIYNSTFPMGWQKHSHVAGNGHGFELRNIPLGIISLRWPSWRAVAQSHMIFRGREERTWKWIALYLVLFLILLLCFVLFPGLVCKLCMQFSYKMEILKI